MSLDFILAPPPKITFLLNVGDVRVKILERKLLSISFHQRIYLVDSKLNQGTRKKLYEKGGCFSISPEVNICWVIIKLFITES
jgi:hypothetical protein